MVLSGSPLQGGVEAEFIKKDDLPDLNEGWAPCNAPLHGPQILHHTACVAHELRHVGELILLLYCPNSIEKLPHFPLICLCLEYS
jgi:hypothetical protein